MLTILHWFYEVSSITITLNSKQPQASFYQDEWHATLNSIVKNLVVGYPLVVPTLNSAIS